MDKCGRGHLLTADTKYPTNGGRWGCRQCRVEIANERWGNTPHGGVSLAERFWNKVEKGSPDECWIWTGARIPKGYGSLGSVEVNGRKRSQVGAHRVAFYLTHGRWPNITRHTCDNPPCVNPAHLLDGDTRSNAADMVARRRSPAQQRTHCPQGHPYDAENTYIKNEAGHRGCRECSRINARRQQAKRVKRGYPASRRTHCPKGHPYSDENTYITKAGHRRCRTCALENSKRQAKKQFERNPEEFRAKNAARARRYLARKRAAASD